MVLFRCSANNGWKPKKPGHGAEINPPQGLFIFCFFHILFIRNHVKYNKFKHYESTSDDSFISRFSRSVWSGSLGRDLVHTAKAKQTHGSRDFRRHSTYSTQTYLYSTQIYPTRHDTSGKNHCKKGGFLVCFQDVGVWHHVGIWWSRAFGCHCWLVVRSAKCE